MRKTFDIKCEVCDSEFQNIQPYAKFCGDKCKNENRKKNRVSDVKVNLARLAGRSRAAGEHDQHRDDDGNKFVFSTDMNDWIRRKRSYTVKAQRA